MKLKRKPALLGLLLIAVAGVSCGSDAYTTTDQPKQQSAAATSTSTTSGSAASTADEHGNDAELNDELIVVAVANGDLVSFERRDGDTTTIASAADLSERQGVVGRFGGFDVSPDRTEVAFTFGNEFQGTTSYRIYTTPIDGSAPPTQRLTWKPDDEFVGAVRYSPTGDTVVVARDTRVTVVAFDDDAWSSLMSIQAPYPPNSFAWSPDGHRITSLDHWERNSCCNVSTISVDPKAGLTMEAEAVPVQGNPWFDQSGTLHSDKRFPYPVDTDASHDVAVTVVTDDDETTRVMWWPTAESPVAPRELKIPVKIDPWSQVAW